MSAPAPTRAVPRFRPVETKIFHDRAALAERLEALRALARDAEKRRESALADETRGGMRPVKAVFTNGCFDLVHPGHAAYLRGARALGTHLIVALNTDESISGLKGPSRPILPLAERLKVVASFDFVDFAIPFAEPDPRPLISALKPDVLVKGGDYTVDQVLGRDEMWSWGGEVQILPLLPGYSTTSFVAKMKGLG